MQLCPTTRPTSKWARTTRDVLRSAGARRPRFAREAWALTHPGPRRRGWSCSSEKAMCLHAAADRAGDRPISAIEHRGRRWDGPMDRTAADRYTGAVRRRFAAGRTLHRACPRARAPDHDLRHLPQPRPRRHAPRRARGRLRLHARSHGYDWDQLKDFVSLLRAHGPLDACSAGVNSTI